MAWHAMAKEEEIKTGIYKEMQGIKRRESKRRVKDSAHQVCIEAIECDEFIVCAELLDLAFAHHCYPVSVADGAEAMRDDDGCLRLRLCAG